MARSVMLVIAAGAMLLTPRIHGEEDKPTEPVTPPPVAESAAGDAAPAAPTPTEAAPAAQPGPAADHPDQSAAEHAQAIFDHLDANDDGEIAAGEVPDDHQRLFRRLLRTADADQNERLNRDELTAGLGSADVASGDDSASSDKSEQRRQRRRRESDNRPGRPERGQRPDGSPRPEGPPLDRLRELDSNQDGNVALDEVPEPRREMFGRLLERFDANDDDSLSGEELDAARAAMARRFSRGSEGRGPEGRRPGDRGPEGRRPGGDGPPGGGPGGPCSRSSSRLTWPSPSRSSLRRADGAPSISVVLRAPS